MEIDQFCIDISYGESFTYNMSTNYNYMKYEGRMIQAVLAAEDYTLAVL